MSNATQSSGDTEKTHSGTIPRAVIHKRILDEAQDQPEASIEEIARRVSGASDTLVERVFNDYGDPADSATDESMSAVTTESKSTSSTARSTPTPEGSGSNETGVSNNTGKIDAEDLTSKQIATLEAILENPTASQSDIAEALGVTAPTVCRRVSDIEEFDWDSRREFVENLFPKGMKQTTREGTPLETNSNRDIEGNLPKTNEELSDLLGALQEIVRKRSTLDTHVVTDPVLASKILRACMSSDEISEEEEVKIVELMVSTTSILD